MKELNIYLYDSFAYVPFGGNVAGVVLDAENLPADVMQYIARELSAPTTGFVVKQSNSTFTVRFFTPTQEIDMCGHVTVAVFTALADEGRLEFEAPGVCTSTQRTMGGDLPIRIHREEGKTIVTMNQNPPVFWQPSIDLTEIAQQLRVSLNDIDLSKPFSCASTALRHLFVPLSGLAAMRKMMPDFASLAKLSHALGVDTIGVYCMEVEQTGSTVHLRDLCPGIGNPEESASGTTNGALASLIVQHNLVSAKNNIVEVVAEQGFGMGRSSIIRSWIGIENEEITSVRVGGTAVRSLWGSIAIPI
ncbi:MAG: PhzF family phenazine biosynthesis protein [Melioribacteraceae bacterium]|nr:PhzF family phenazine biosynthesis protein [Melioribacteraceae bacterium]MCF8356114.1 PhzF family phenazine biosynthesis protein [Melioribacteraceae bacterium]MCF8396423.1 PhzF family phenazine biosynthesis protein [Melioribacteraceae bacterium]